MGQPGDLLAELPVQLIDLVGEGLNGGDLSLADRDLYQAAGVGGGWASLAAPAISRGGTRTTRSPAASRSRSSRPHTWRQVLHRPDALRPAYPRPADQLAMPQHACRHGPLVKLPTGPINRDDGVGVLVWITPSSTMPASLPEGTLGRPAGMPQLGRCHAPGKPRRSAHDGRDGMT
jgi:hypothetical protein